MGSLPAAWEGDSPSPRAAPKRSNGLKLNYATRGAFKLCVQGYSAIGSIASHCIDDANPNLGGVGHECFDRNLLESLIIE